MIDADQLDTLIDRILYYLHPEIPYSKHAKELLLMTAAHESGLGTYLAQKKGPARGIYQVEPTTEQHVLAKLSATNRPLYNKLTALNLLLDGQDGSTTDNDSYHNLAYQTALARCIYFLKPGSIPTTPEGMAAYAKKYWNTPKGKATELDYLLAYRRIKRKGGTV